MADPRQSERGPPAVVGGCLLMVLGGIIAIVGIFVGVSGFAVSILALGSLGGGLLTKAAVVLLSVLATLLVFIISAFCLHGGFKLMAKRRN